MKSDTIYAELAEAELKQWAGKARKTSTGNVIGTGTVSLPPELQIEVARDFQALVAGKLRQVEGASWTSDGRAIPVEVRGNRIDYGGKSAVLLHVRDITERKLAEAALRSSEMLFHSVWENSVDGMRLTDENGNIVAVNDAFCKLVGMPKHELEGSPLTVIYADSTDPAKIYRNIGSASAIA